MNEKLKKPLKDRKEFIHYFSLICYLKLDFIMLVEHSKYIGGNFHLPLTEEKDLI